MKFKQRDGDTSGGNGRYWEKCPEKIWALIDRTWWEINLGVGGGKVSKMNTEFCVVQQYVSSGFHGI